MKTLKKSFLVVFCVLIAFTLAIGLVACKDKDGEEIFTYLNISASETADKTYLANVSVESEELTFSNFDKENYGIEVVDIFNPDEAVRQITEFTITKVSDAQIDVSFVDTDYLGEDDSWRLYSKSPVLNDGSKLDCSIYLGTVTYGLLSSETDINRYDNNIVLTISLTDGTLVNPLTKENINVSGALFEKDYTLQRINDTTFSLTYVDAFKDDVTSASQTTVALSGDAIKGNKPFNVFMDFEIKTPSAEIDSSAIQLITVADGTKVIVPIILSDGFAKTINTTDVSVTGVEGFTVEQVDMVGENFMVVTLKTALNSAECIDKLNIAKLEFKATAIDLGGQKASMSFGDFQSDIIVTASCDYTDEGFNGYVLKINAKNGTFKNYAAITANDIEIKNTKGVAYDFTLTSKSEKMLVVKLNTTDTTIAGSVTIGSALINSRFGLIEADLKGSFTAAYIEDDKNFLAIALPILTNMAKSAATSAASTVGSKIGAAITPYIMDFLGLPQETTLEDINKNVNKLGTQLHDLQHQVNEARASIERDVANGTYMTMLDDYNREYNDITLYILEVYGNRNGLARILALEEACIGDGEVTDEKLAELEANPAYVAAKNVFKTQFETYGALFPAKIKTFGDNLNAKGAGVSYGYFHAYWGLMENNHLWDIQTIAPKEQFLNASATAYYLAMSSVLRYFEITKSTGSLANYQASFGDITKVIEKYAAHLQESINRRTIHATLEYSTGRVVNLHLLKYKAKSSDNKSIATGTRLDVYHPTNSFFSEKEFEKILNTARTKKVEFLQSLRDAGFYGAPSEGTTSIKIAIRRSDSSQDIYGYRPQGRYGMRRVTTGTITSYHINYVTYNQNTVNGIFGGNISGTSASTYATVKYDRDARRQTLTYVDTTNEYYMFDGPYWML